MELPLSAPLIVIDKNWNHAKPANRGLIYLKSLLLAALHKNYPVDYSFPVLLPEIMGHHLSIPTILLR